MQRVDRPESTRLTRRALVGAAGAAAAGLLAPRAPGATWALGRAAAGATPPIAHSFATRPELAPPTVSVLTTTAGAAPGHVFVAPFTLPSDPPADEASGLLIFDGAGAPIWFRPITKGNAMDLRVQRLRGRRVLTWWEGVVFGGYGGSWRIADDRYRTIATVRAGNGYKGDLHDLVLTSRGTALITIYNELRSDLTSIGGAADGRVVEGIVQEVELATGAVLFEWHSLDHVALEETHEPQVTRDGNVDYFHLNSVGIDDDGHLLLSARHTSAVYKVHRRTGAVLWRLGGKRSDFALGPGVAFAYQHDARRHDDGTLTLFDNVAWLPSQKDLGSRAIRLRLDTVRMTARLVEERRTGDVRPGWAMGNAEQLADGGLFVGWGMFPGFTEFDRNGAVRFDARFNGLSVSYRAGRYPWVGRPADRPAVAARRGTSGNTVVFASWNGATEVARWRVLAGSSRSDLGKARVVARRGFETAIGLRGAPRYAAVVALDRAGQPLGASPIVSV
jgi:hypothetical protein